MKRRTEHLVEKRDGRREYLRVTKLARSIHLAMIEVGVDEDWRALDLAAVVLAGLRDRRPSEAAMLRTAELAEAVQHLLLVTGQQPAAVAYGEVQAERARRRLTLQRRNDALLAAAAPPNGTMTPDQPNGSRIGGIWPGKG